MRRTDRGRRDEALGTPRHHRRAHRQGGPTRLLLLGLLVTLAACVSPGHPRAGPRPTSELKLSDPMGDLVVLRGEHSPVDAHAGRNVDVLSAEVTRTTRSLRVAVRYADLRMDADGQWQIDVRFTSSGDRLTHEVLWERGTYPDSSRRYDSIEITAATSDDASPSSCPGLRREADEAARAVTVVVPDRCLGRPQQVRLTSIVAQNAMPGSGRHYEDVVYDENDSRRPSPLVVLAA